MRRDSRGRLWGERERRPAGKSLRCPRGVFSGSRHDVSRHAPPRARRRPAQLQQPWLRDDFAPGQDRRQHRPRGRRHHGHRLRRRGVQRHHASSCRRRPVPLAARVRGTGDLQARDRRRRPGPLPGLSDQADRAAPLPERDAAGDCFGVQLGVHARLLRPGQRLPPMSGPVERRTRTSGTVAFTLRSTPRCAGASSTTSQGAPASVTRRTGSRWRPERASRRISTPGAPR